ncbi:MAG: C4-dicarboxylate ABC transporter substrate-binding protein [Rubrivivax sp.]|jgi:hypothetical protein|nr:C4-dicarboxylate ABC transporter substrate-binding protein [Rubrivivax sp.]
MSEAKPDTPEGWRAVLLRWWVLPLAAALLALAYLLLQPQPPRQVVLATGIERSAYVAFGEQYRQALQRHGIDVTLRATQGAADNLALLRQPGSGVDIGFVQGGTDEQDSASAQETDGLVSLGTVFLEPVWLFYRLDTAQQRHGRQTLQHLAELKGWSINIGAAGSGVPPLMQHLLALNRLDASDLLVQQQPVTPAVVDLLEGRVDALVLASAPESSMVQMLLQTPGIGLLDFAQSEAYARRLPYLRPVVLPRGVVDLARDIPAQDIRLLAPTASLLARADLHPALAQLLALAAQQAHGGPGWFQQRDEFPNAGDGRWPLHPEAQRIQRAGAPWLQRYVPFWLANLADRMWLALLAIVAVLLPLSRVVPPLIEFRIRSRVFRWYAELREIEAAPRPLAQRLAELDDVETKAGRVKLPLSHADELYALRSHIQFVRRRLQQPLPRNPPSGEPHP